MSDGRPWLSVIGIGADGMDGLLPIAMHHVLTAQHIFGGRRHLDLLPERINATLHAWSQPIQGRFAEIASRRGTPTVVLASGDPFLFGIGSLLANRFDAEEMAVYPAPSSVSIACARLRWSGQEARLISACGRDTALLTPHLQPNAKIFVLSADNTTPRSICTQLQRDGFGESDVTVLEHLGGVDERIRRFKARDRLPDDITNLNLMAIEVAVSSLARVIPLATGLPDAFFLHDGQLTKQEIRAVTLSALGPTQGACLWDIGAGSGAISIEWMLRHPSNRAVAFEKDSGRLARIAENARRLGVPNIEMRHATLPEHDVPEVAPDAIFIGGGLSQRDLLGWAWQRLRIGGRLVANAVTLEGESILGEEFQQRGGEMTRLSVSRAEKIGRFHGFRPAMTVTQWSLTKE